MNILFKKGFIYLALMLFVLISFNVERASAAEAVDYEEGVTNLNNTPENSAVVGSVLKNPEIGWKRYDDKNQKIIIGNSSHVRSAFGTPYYKDRSSQFYNNSSATFNFSGTKLRIISTKANGYSTNIEVSIDGKVVDVFSQSSDPNITTLRTITYEKNNLTPGTHTVVIKNVKANDRPFDIDAIDVDGYLISENEIPKVESITLDKNNLELFEGDSEKLTATVTPDSANVIWMSSDESIATVDQNGNVIAIKEGVITVTAQVPNSNLTANCVVIVKKRGNTESESITLDRNVLELLEGSQDKLTATVLPEDSLNKNVIWSSSDETIATIDQNGNVTAIREGEATIFAKVENTELVATATVIVKKPNNESSSAILSITLVNGITKEYDVTNTVLNNYLNWFESAQGTSTFKFSKTISPYKKVTEYIVHDKIASFEVREY
ncbi:Ig-like domain-containing protein [Lysinibacillus sp. NPDC048646]|uniref:Ig-like domain-containing protein n=1 Tax=Lysinibacillus sp. NPDC048646 TaxID=3390574 RepID=UPI003D072962